MVRLTGRLGMAKAVDQTVKHNTDIQTSSLSQIPKSVVFQNVVAYQIEEIKHKT